MSNITEYISYNPEDIERVSSRPQKKIEIVEPNPTWPTMFSLLEARVRAVLPEDAFIFIQHIGSTSVPDLPAKDIIDIDIVVPDPTVEETYVPALEKAGFQFLHGEPKWHEHRFFGCHEPYANIHVFGPDSPEVVRHRLFRDWLREHEGDRKLYAGAKRIAAKDSREHGETTEEYNGRKEQVIRQVLKKVYKAHGLLRDEKAS